MGAKAKVLFLDIETSFKIAGIWKRWKEDVSMDQIFQDTYVLSWAAKWLGEKKTLADALFLHPKTYKADPTDDSAILRTVWKLLDEADYVVAHNGAAFDLPVLNSRFIQLGLKPPSPYAVIDTLNIARKKFKFTSNRLGDIGIALGVGGKLKTDFSLWKQVVIDRSVKAFRRMVEYNRRDVVVLEAVYDKLKAWDRSHPDVHKHTNGTHCNVCGSRHLQRRGVYRLASGDYVRYQCRGCGHWMRGSSVENRRKNVLRGV